MRYAERLEYKHKLLAMIDTLRELGLAGKKIERPWGYAVFPPYFGHQIFEILCAPFTKPVRLKMQSTASWDCDTYEIQRIVILLEDLRRELFHD